MQAQNRRTIFEKRVTNPARSFEAAIEKMSKTRAKVHEKTTRKRRTISI